MDRTLYTFGLPRMGIWDELTVRTENMCEVRREDGGFGTFRINNFDRSRSFRSFFHTHLGHNGIVFIPISTIRTQSSVT